MSHDAGHEHDDHHGIGHVAPLRALVLTGAALLFLTFLTVWVVNIDVGEYNIYIALAIAVVKGAIVALYFMHLRWDRPFNSIVFIGSIAAVMLFIALAMTDSHEYKPDQDAYVNRKLIQIDQSVFGDGADVQAAIKEFQAAAPAPAPAADDTMTDGAGDADDQGGG